MCSRRSRSEERRVGKECRYWRDWSSDVCSSDLAQEGASKGITVNAIAPGYTDTDMVSAVPANVLEKIVAKIPVGRLGKADEIARGVLFLIADDAGFITGSTLSINGGQHMY